MKLDEAFAKIHDDVQKINQGVLGMRAQITNLRDVVTRLTGQLEGVDLNQQQQAVLAELDTTVASLEEAAPDTVKVENLGTIGSTNTNASTTVDAGTHEGDEEAANEDTLESLQADNTRDQLVAIAQAEGAAVSGSKADIAAAIIAKRAGAAGSEESGQ